MKAAILFSGSGPIVILTSYDSIEHPQLLKRLANKGLAKFVAFEIDVDYIRGKYGSHFEIVCENLHETDDLRVLDFDGSHAIKLIPFSMLGEPIVHEPAPAGV